MCAPSSLESCGMVHHVLTYRLMFQKTCCLIFKVEESSVLKMDVQFHLIIWYVPTKLHAVTSQKTVNIIYTTVTTLNVEF
jgi:hypothetical protein